MAFQNNFKQILEGRINDIREKKEDPVLFELSAKMACCCGHCGYEAIKRDDSVFPLTSKKAEMSYLKADHVDKYWPDAVTQG